MAVARTNDAPDGAQVVALAGELELASGGKLSGVQVAYETYGRLAEDGSNAVLICHALSGDSHVTSGDAGVNPGWWEPMVGPGRAIDTDKLFVICSNVIGGCSGTTGPGSIDPGTGLPYGGSFPFVTVEDMVEVQRRLLDHLGVGRLAAVVGGSMGGMQALAWARLHPDRITAVVADATTPRLGAQSIAFNEVGRRAILEDPDFKGGDYYGSERQPDAGLGIARMVGHITYLSNESMGEKFGRRLREGSEYAFDFVHEFEVETYLAYQGRRFTERFDANTYLLMTKAMDYFDLRAGAGTLAEAVTQTPQRWLVTSFSSDWLFTTAQSRELVTALLANDKHVTFAEFDSPYGHDAFLLEVEQQTSLLRPFLDNAVRACAAVQDKEAVS